MPIFSGDPDEDVELFLDLFRGYLAGLGINPADNAGNPTGHSRALGLLRGCMRGPAGEWFDQYLTGKNWELYNVFENHGQANWGALVARTMPQLTGTASFRAGSLIDVFARVGANAGVTLAQRLPPAGLDQNWTQLGGRPTDRPISAIVAGGGANPLVIQLRVGNAIQYFRENYTTVLRERREIRFGNLTQGNDSVRDYYRKVIKYGRMLGFQNNVVEDQFLRGLSPDNMLELDRLVGADRPIAEVVDALERIERRKAEMRLGLTNRSTQQEIIQKSVTPIQVPPVSAQEPVITKQVAPHELSHEQLNRLLKEQAENLTNAFKAQIQALQDKIAQQSAPQIQPVQPAPRPEKQKPPVPPKNWEQLLDTYESASPFDDDREYSFDEIMGGSNPMGNKMMEDLAVLNLARKKVKKAKMNRRVNTLARQMAGLKLNDDFDPMDTSNLADGSVILEDENGNEFIVHATRSVKKK
jgi:hypothetical protein